MKNISRLILLVSLISLFGCNFSRKEVDWKNGVVQEQFIYEKASFPSCHAGTIAETPEGIIAAFFGGTHERNPDVCIYTSHLINDEWTTPVAVADGIDEDGTRYPTWNPVLYQIPEGNLLLFYKVGPHPSQWWGMMKQSADNGKTWSEAEKLPEGYVGPVKNKPVLLDDGTLICPTSTEGNGWHVHFEMTKDWGKTWTKTENINNYKVHNIIQPSILKYENGDLQILCRSKNSVLVSAWSKDNGKTWGLTQPSGLPNNNSGTDAVTLQDGRQLVVYNHVATPVNASKGHRTPLNVAVSNNGKDWYASLILEDSEISQYSYPAVIQGSDGMIHIIYTWRRERMKYIKVDPTQLNLVPIVNEKWPTL